MSCLKFVGKQLESDSSLVNVTMRIDGEPLAYCTMAMTLAQWDRLGDIRRKYADDWRHWLEVTSESEQTA